MDGVKLHAKIYQTNTSHGKTHCNAAFVGTHRNPCGNYHRSYGYGFWKNTA